MSTRRRIGVSHATTEAARRQLMQPVPCWEQTWVPSEVNPNLKVYKWVKTEKVQHFSDDEAEDEPLAPLPDEPEIIDGDDEMEQDDTAAPSRAEPAAKEAETQDVEPEETGAEDSKAPSPKPQLTLEQQDTPGDIADELDASLKPLEESLDDVSEGRDDTDMQLDISGLGPDGLPLEASHDLSQLTPSDVLVGGSVMDQSGDPFAETT
ncbi:hypothetical protein DFP72DRAFT_1057745 [Ephemerocybe angulata]|uniref:Uncharacterized protein n=1 Tax=Ephemerocybe angulata TaxID=980116 RepID=A0A8H6MHJ0_9AGAR|nr:hypothetical protein DFP72DRAFT_1057745 [Tulosesus angulatus]